LLFKCQRLIVRPLTDAIYAQYVREPATMVHFAPHRRITGAAKNTETATLAYSTESDTFPRFPGSKEVAKFWMVL
jgi:hypothetical protein